MCSKHLSEKSWVRRFRNFAKRCMYKGKATGNNSTIVPGADEPQSSDTLIDLLASSKKSVVKKAYEELVQNRDVGALLRGLKHPEPAVRKWSARLLGEMEDRSSVPLLEEAVTDEFFSVQEAAVTALAKIGAIESVPSIVASLQRIPHAACSALCQLGASEELSNTLKHSDPGVRQEMLRCAKDLPEPLLANVVQTIVSERIYNDTNHMVASEAIALLGRFGGPTIFENLLGLLASREDHTVTATGKALGLLAKRKGVLSDRERRLSSAISCLVQRGTSTGVLSSEAAVIEELADKRIIPALELFLSSKYDPDIRSRIAVAARKTGELEVLIKAAPNCEEAAIELGKTENEGALEPLLELAKAKQRGAILGLGHIGKAQDVIVDTLLPLLKNTQIRWAAAESLGRIGDRRAFSTLEAVLRGQIENRVIHEPIVKATACCGGPLAVEVLVRAFKAIMTHTVDGSFGRDSRPVVDALMMLEKQGDVKAEDIDAVNTILGLFGKGAIMDSLDHIVNFPDKRFTPAVLHSASNEYSFCDTPLRHSSSFVPHRYVDALDALKDETELLVWLKHLYMVGGMVPDIIVTALGRVGTEDSMDALLSLLTKSLSEGNLYSYVIDTVKAIGLICSRIGTTLDRAKLTNVKQKLQMAARYNWVNLAEAAKIELEHMSF